MWRLTDLLRRRHVGRVLVAVFAGRLPEGMVALGVVLLVRADGGSYGLAGLLAALLAVGAAVGGPPLGRLVDRHGQPAIVLASAILRGGALVGLTLASADAPVVAGVCAVLCGLTTPPLEPALRALWVDLTRDAEQAESAYRLEAGLQELIFVLGPLALSAFVALSDPAVALQLTAAGGLIGPLVFATAPPARAWRSAPRPDAAWGAAVRAPGIAVVLAIAALVGVVIGTVNVAAPAFAEVQDVAAGWLLAAFAFGGLVGGLWAAAREPRHPVEHTLPLLLLGVGVAFAPALAGPGLAGMLVLLALGGGLMAPALGSAFIVVGRRALQGAVAETFAWLTSGVLVGIATGSAVAGPLSERAGGTDGFAVALAAGALAAAVWRLAGHADALRVPAPSVFDHR